MRHAIPPQTIGADGFRYSLVSYEADGVERPDAGTAPSDEVVDAPRL